MRISPAQPDDVTKLLAFREEAAAWLLALGTDQWQRPYPADRLLAAIDAGALVQPAAIRYLDADGARSAAAPFVGDMTFVDSLLRVLRAPVLRAEVSFGSLLGGVGRTRRELAARAVADVARLLGVAPPPAQRSRIAVDLRWTATASRGPWRSRT